MDAVRLGHIGVEVVALSALTYYVIDQNKKLQTQVDDLKRQMGHLAVHVNHSLQELERQVKQQASELTKLRTRPVREPEPPRRSREQARARLSASAVTTPSPIPPPPLEPEPIEDEASDSEDVDRVLQSRIK